MRNETPELRVIADYGDLCGEGPIWDADSSSLYWSDCVGKQFYRYHQPSGKHEIVKRDLEINGVALNRAGGFVITNNDGIWIWDGIDKIQLIADMADGSRCRINDAIADPEGRLFAGSWFYDPSGNYELGKLIRFDTDGSAQVVDEGFHLANGLAFSPDTETLYFTDSVARRIYAYDYDRKTGSIRGRRVVVQVPDSEGVPDGLTVDAEGFLWSAQWYGSCVIRYDPSGNLERRIRTPAKQTSSVMFGGKDLNEIFITSAARPEPMPVMPPGYDPESGYVGGRLYCLTLPIQGKPEYRTDFKFRS